MGRGGSESSGYDNFMLAGSVTVAEWLPLSSILAALEKSPGKRTGLQNVTIFQRIM